MSLRPAAAARPWKWAEGPIERAWRRALRPPAGLTWAGTWTPPTSLLRAWAARACARRPETRRTSAGGARARRFPFAAAGWRWRAASAQGGGRSSLLLHALARARDGGVSTRAPVAIQQRPSPQRSGLSAARRRSYQPVVAAATVMMMVMMMTGGGARLRSLHGLGATDTVAAASTRAAVVLVAGLLSSFAAWVGPRWVSERGCSRRGGAREPSLPCAAMDGSETFPNSPGWAGCCAAMHRAKRLGSWQAGAATFAPTAPCTHACSHAYKFCR
eukprot:scaffold374_cov380-Prasinococcus_capsulatus_cf.AAC.6